jgi:EAL domain-containing protein (putative c-di-GMP-specific phosphodiesterase class I)
MTEAARPMPSTAAVEELGARLRHSFPAIRVHLCSVHGPNGEVLWLSEGVLGPDESDAVLRAYEQFSGRDAPAFVFAELGDGRSAVVLACRASRRHFGGSVLLVVDSNRLRPETASEQFTSGSVPRLLEDLAILIGPPVEDPAEASAAAQQSATDTGATAIGRRINLPIPAAQVDAGVDRLFAALRRTPISLYVQPLVPLGNAAKSRHYEVLIRSGDGANEAPLTMLARATKAGLASMIDRRVLTILLAWAVRNRAALQAGSAVLSVNLSGTALRDEHFGRFLELCLAKAELPSGLIGFEISEQACLAHLTGLSALAALLERLGCPWAVDDFTGSRASLELLRLRGLTMVKLHGTMTGRLSASDNHRRDLRELLQVTRMVGVTTTAKGVNDAPDRAALASLGVDFLQSFSAAPPAPIETLLERAAGTGLGLV